MNYPFTLWIPAGLSLLNQMVLWFSYFFFIPSIDQTAVLWLSVGGIAAALLFLVIYRVFAIEMSPWSKSFLICSLIQFASIAGCGYFVGLIFHFF